MRSSVDEICLLVWPFLQSVEQIELILSCINSHLPQRDMPRKPPVHLPSGVGQALPACLSTLSPLPTGYTPYLVQRLRCSDLYEVTHCLSMWILS